MPRGIAKDHDEKRAALRKGAAAYFARHGYDRASMTATARACGVSKALIYHYYGSKEALLFDILNAHLSELTDTAEAATDQGLDRLIHDILMVYEDADAEHKLQLGAMETLPDDLRAPLVALQRRVVRSMSDAIRSEQPALTGERLRAVTMSVFGILNWFYMWHRPGTGLSRADYAQLAAGFVRGGLHSV